MILDRLDPEEFKMSFNSGCHLFTSVDFTMMNGGKASEICCLGLRANGKLRLGIILGKRNEEWKSPFSAPFGGIVASKKQSIEAYFTFARGLAEFAASENIPVRIIPASPIYDEDCHVKSCCAMSGFIDSENSWIAHYYSLESNIAPQERMDRNARADLKKTINSGCNCIISCDISEAYGLISEHHKNLGYPVNMSLSDLERMRVLTDIRSFIITRDRIPLSAAIVYSLSGKIALPVLWGDSEEGRKIHSMHPLAFHIIEYYTQKGFRTIDFGQTSSPRNPNPGLCSFKESIGAKPYFKPCFLIRP